MSKAVMQLALRALEFEAKEWEDVPPITRNAIDALRQAMQIEREWVGLTDEEQTQVAWSCGSMSVDWLEFAQAIEAKLKEKNNG